MTLEAGWLLAAATGYLSLLFLIALAAERGWLPDRLLRHPAVYVLSLGVFATSWSFYGSVGFAASDGYQFLTIYLGPTLAFLLAPVLLAPILRLAREHQLTSLADLFTFRYRSQAAGVAVTLFMLVGSLPYIALQIRAVTESAQVLTRQTPPHLLALAFCALLILFATLFGARHAAPGERHEGLVAAVAFESLVKLAALLAVGALALFGVFGGPGGLNEWLAANPAALERMYEPVHSGSWTTLLLLAFAAAFLLPRQFHMAFTEATDARGLRIAAWGFPLFLLLLNLAIPPILWAGQERGLAGAPDYFVLALPQAEGNALLTIAAFLGGVSAASAMVIVTTLALAAMAMNHLLLPASLTRRPPEGGNLYRWLLWSRRGLVALIILAGYAFHLLLQQRAGLVEMGLISFVAVAQFLPGIVGLLLWPRATRQGFVAGLLGGGTVWAGLLLLPLLERAGFLAFGLDPAALLGTVATESPWFTATTASLAVNGALFLAVSLATRPTEAEARAARACVQATPPATGVVAAGSAEQFSERLAEAVGPEVARREVRRALKDLDLAPDEDRPGELTRLREQIERNLSGLMGPLLARMIVDERLRLEPHTRQALADTVRHVEARLADSTIELHGLSRELDSLRRYHRQVLHDLPLGAATVALDGEVIHWNQSLVTLTGIDEEAATGRPVAELPAPWGGLLAGFLRTDDRRLRKVQVGQGEATRWLNLHKAAIEADRDAAGTVVLVEDLTDLQRLEAELAHSERLASVGRLAAGVAHEIGNPVTNIDGLAQALDPADPQAVTTGLGQIRTQTRRISDILQALMRFSHGGDADTRASEPVAVAPLVEEAIRLVAVSGSGKRAAFERHIATDLAVLGDEPRLLQVLVNLLGNAADASPAGGTVEISAEAEGDAIVLDLIDEGGGIEPDHLERLFEPFFTTKAPGEGTGLGLAVVYHIVQAHYGRIDIESRAGEGTRVNLRLPAAPAPETRHEEPI
ncbi:Two-component sensor kinase CbrA [Thiohalospira halophila DSM 15071]|uniref:histidine kinase n=2 Tax=Thiohalospira halophila TaxID=381300 RepID=A0A1I1NBS1_9GAMM|nr:Two-component sensor kinase CbrA [Thiohalospira halophila DSM 15071]